MRGSPVAPVVPAERAVMADRWAVMVVRVARVVLAVRVPARRGVITLIRVCINLDKFSCL